MTNARQCLIKKIEESDDNTLVQNFDNAELFKPPLIKQSKMETMSVKNLDVFKFINAVKSEIFLYDKNHNEYRNSDKRQQIWNQIAVQFGFADGKDAYKKWKYLKDHFFAEKKKISHRGMNDGGDYKKWQYYDSLKWAEEFLEKRKSGISTTDEQLEESSPRSTSTPTTFNFGLDEISRHQLESVINNNRLQLDGYMSNATQSVHHNTNQYQNSQNDKKLVIDEKESEMEALLFRPFESSNISAGINDLMSSKQQQQQLHQALIAESEEELFGRLVARDLVRLPANLRPLARLKIQELLYHFSIGHVPEMH